MSTHWHTTNNLPHYVAESGPRRYESLEEAKAGLAADMSFVADAIHEWTSDSDVDPPALDIADAKVARYRAMAKRILDDRSPGGTWRIGEDEWSMDKCDLPNCRYGVAEEER